MWAKGPALELSRKIWDVWTAEQRQGQPELESLWSHLFGDLNPTALSPPLSATLLSSLGFLPVALTWASPDPTQQSTH